MIIHLVEYSASVIEIVIMAFFITSFLGSKFEGKKKYIFIILVMVADFLLGYFADCGWPNENLRTILTITLYFLYAVMFLKGNCFKKVFATVIPMVLNYAIAIVVPTTVSFITKVPLYDMVNEFSSVRLITLILTKVALFYAAWIILCVVQKNKYIFSKSQLLLILVIQAISMVAMALILNDINYVQRENLNKTLIISSYLGIIGANIMCLLLVNRVNQANKAKEENLLLIQQNEYQEKYIKAAMQMQKESQKLKHDLKHYFLTVSQMLENNEVSKAKEYVDGFVEEKIDQMVVLVNTGNKAIDAILGTKFSVCHENTIKVSYEITSNLENIPGIDISNLLANLLDNAIEASLKDVKREIRVIIQRSKKYLLISVRNHIDFSVLEKNPRLETSKEDSSIHGIGTKSVNDIVNRYSGAIKYLEEDGMFICNIMLKMN